MISDKDEFMRVLRSLGIDYEEDPFKSGENCVSIKNFYMCIFYFDEQDRFKNFDIC